MFSFSGVVPAATAQCVDALAPSLPPPAVVPSGVEGFHAAWYGQSGYATLCPGHQSNVVVAYYNSGTRAWVAGRPGETAFLGTSGPVPGQDRSSVLGGDGTHGSPNTNWPSYGRPAMQPAPYVGPGQVAWFEFTVQAPLAPGSYRLALRPLIRSRSDRTATRAGRDRRDYPLHHPGGRRRAGLGRPDKPRVAVWARQTLGRWSQRDTHVWQRPPSCCSGGRSPRGGSTGSAAIQSHWPRFDSAFR